jgi:hypothetical protein
MGKLNRKTLKDVEVTEECQVKISMRFAAFENLGDTEGTKRAWENIGKNIKISANDSLSHYEWKQQKPWFEEER